MPSNALKFDPRNAPSKGSTSSSKGTGFAPPASTGKKPSWQTDGTNNAQSRQSYEGSPAVVDTTRGGASAWRDRATESVSNGLGANNTYEDKAGQFISENPYTAPDYKRNWVNDGQPLDFANRHGTEVTNEWARGAEAFNNMRHWNPGTAGELGTIGGSGSTSGTIGDVGRSERWEPIDTQELRAQQRAEDREADVMGKGIARQNMYAQYPYDMSVAHQQAQMDADYGLDTYRGHSFTDYQMLIQKANDASNATGVYAQALWGLAGIGGYLLNPYDREAYNQMAAVMNRSDLSVDAKRTECEHILRGITQYKMDSLGLTLNEVMDMVKSKVASGQLPDVMSVIMQSLYGGIYNRAGHNGSGVFF